MQLAGASFADAHPQSGFAQRQRLAVVALEDLALARWQAGHRGAHTRSEILRLVALRDLVLLRSAVVPALDELVERHGPVVGARLPLRRGRALAPTVRPSKLVHATDFVEDRPADPQARITLEGDTSLGIELIDGVDQPDESSRLEIVGTRDRTHRYVHAVRNPGGERREALDERASRRGIAPTTLCPQQGRVRQGPPPPRRTPTKDLV